MSTYGKAVPAGLAPHGLGKPVAESTYGPLWLARLLQTGSCSPSALASLDESL